MKLVSESESKIVPASKMKIGQVAYIRNDRHECSDHVILRHYSGFVSLTDPRMTWGAELTLMVEIIEEGTQLTFEVEV